MKEKIQKDGVEIELTSSNDLVESLLDDSFKLRVCLYGRSGSGKSRMASTMPGKKGVIDTDNGALVYGRANDCVIASIPEDFVFAKTKTSGSVQPPSAWKKVIATANVFTQDESIGTIVVDSLTTVSDACMKHIQHMNMSTNKNPSWPEYYAQMEALKEFILLLFTSGKHVIVTAHEQMNKDEFTGRVWCEPLVTGKLSAKLPMYFDEVYHMEPGRTTKGDPIYRVMTRSDSLYTAKSRIDSLIDRDVLELADLSIVVSALKNYAKTRKEATSNESS